MLRFPPSASPARRLASSLTADPTFKVPKLVLAARIVPSRRGAGTACSIDPQGGDGKAAKHVAMSWAQRLKRVFGIDINACEFCGGAVKIIASIEDSEVIEAILAQVGLNRTDSPRSHTPQARGPPEGEFGFFD